MRMKQALLAMLAGMIAVGCQQKADQQAAQPAADLDQSTQRAYPPKPAMRQSDARVWVDAVTAEAGTSGSFGVHYYGVEEVKAIVVPLSYPKGMHIDSISFAGSILEYIATRPTRIDNDENMALFSAIPTSEPLIPAKEGLMATFHFTLSADAVSGIIEDAFMPPANYLTYVDSASTQVEPLFEPANLTVGGTP